VLDKVGLPVMVSGWVEATVVDPVAAAVKVVDYEDATRTIAQTAIRAVLKERPASDFTPAELDAAILEVVDEPVHSWGVAISSARLNVTAGA
jgi:regulator of protease activity HflC (stomatin/prohibitin superfamily)